MYKNSNEIKLFDRKCDHAGGRLISTNKNKIICPMHKWEFDPSTSCYKNNIAKPQIKFQETEELIKFNIDEDILLAVKKAHKNRLKEDPNLTYLQNLRQRYDVVSNKKELSLNLVNRKEEKQERKDWLLSVENERRENNGLDTFDAYADLEEFNKNKDDSDIDIDVENDYLLQETANIIADYIYLNNKLLISKLN